MTETRIGNFFLLSNNLRSKSNNAFQEPNSINSDSELQNFEAVASLVVHQNRILAKENNTVCKSITMSRRAKGNWRKMLGK
ncbi:hypothetical protein Avbf_06408 [Armadillidium vulgare]|nr:hypothetical protein Avbf_06408 [Armadillidium vulgare]